MMPTYRVTYEWSTNVEADSQLQAVQLAEIDRCEDIPDDEIVRDLTVVRVEQIPDPASDLNTQAKPEEA